MTTHLLAAGMGMTGALAIDRAFDGRFFWAGIYGVFTSIDALLLVAIFKL